MELLNQNHTKHALYMVVVLIVCLALMEVTGNNQSFDSKSRIQIVLMFVAPAVIWYLGIKERKKTNKNKLPFKTGLQEGFKISLFYGIISPFVFMLYYLLFNPEILSYVSSAYGLQGASNQIVILVDMVAQFFSAVVFGSIYAAIISFFLKTK